MNKDSVGRLICSNCGKSIDLHEASSLICGRCRDFVLCSECKDKVDDFVKWSDEK